MAIATVSKRNFTTVKELLQHLGGIPANRVRLHPAPGKATARDVVRIHDRENRLFELIDGVLVEKAVGYLESFLAGTILLHLRQFVDARDLGVVVGEAGMMRLGKNLVRIPDVSFVSWERLPGRKIPREPIPDLVPDLAIEVLSASNTKREMTRKLEEYFAVGVRLVWFMRLKDSTVEVFSSPETSVVLHKGDTLDGGQVLPGFAVPVKRLFAQPGSKS